MSKTITSKVISQSSDDRYAKWELPNVSDASLQLPTAQEIDRIETVAYEEGLKSGYEEGFKKGLVESQQEVSQRCENLDTILKFLQRPLDDLDEKVTDQLFHLAMTVTGQLIRRELHTDPGQIVAVVREAMASLPIAERKVNIYLHPDDANIVRDTLSLHHDSESQPWRIMEDPLLSRGGCRLQAGQSYIDASVEKRLNRIIATLLGGERNSDLNVYEDTSLDNENRADDLIIEDDSRLSADTAPVIDNEQNDDE
ncbi:Flagellar assembly protein FliH [hydrothermal vent metagenome]|uniref:Flagellar assembly protein FliH n=1 Tax=hydrothermal vent metagenome TaxID=652676 RepID=A0A3B1AW95_9ZZZZ